MATDSKDIISKILQDYQKNIQVLELKFNFLKDKHKAMSKVILDRLNYLMEQAQKSLAESHAVCSNSSSTDEDINLSLSETKLAIFALEHQLKESSQRFLPIKKLGASSALISPSSFTLQSGSITPIAAQYRPSLDSRMIIGDLHGDASRLLRFLLESGCVDSKNAAQVDIINTLIGIYHSHVRDEAVIIVDRIQQFITDPTMVTFDEYAGEGDYADGGEKEDIGGFFDDLENYYTSSRYSTAVLDDFKLLLDQLYLIPGIKLHLLGDELFDRGHSDLLTMMVLQRMQECGVDFEISLSNHAEQFYEAYIKFTKDKEWPDIYNEMIKSISPDSGGMYNDMKSQYNVLIAGGKTSDTERVRCNFMKSAAQVIRTIGQARSYVDLVNTIYTFNKSEEHRKKYSDLVVNFIEKIWMPATSLVFWSRVESAESKSQQLLIKTHAPVNTDIIREAYLWCLTCEHTKTLTDNNGSDSAKIIENITAHKNEYFDNLDNLERALDHIRVSAQFLMRNKISLPVEFKRFFWTRYTDYLLRYSAESVPSYSYLHSNTNVARASLFNFPSGSNTIQVNEERTMFFILFQLPSNVINIHGHDGSPGDLFERVHRGKYINLNSNNITVEFPQLLSAVPPLSSEAMTVGVAAAASGGPSIHLGPECAGSVGGGAGAGAADGAEAEREDAHVREEEKRPPTMPLAALSLDSRLRQVAIASSQYRGIIGEIETGAEDELPKDKEPPVKKSP